MIITPREFEEKMCEIVNNRSLADDDKHSDADKLMCKVLVSLGYEVGVRIFNDMDKRYS